MESSKYFHDPIEKDFLYESVLTACELATFECSLEPETDIENF